MRIIIFEVVKRFQKPDITEADNLQHSILLKPFKTKLLAHVPTKEKI